MDLTAPKAVLVVLLSGQLFAVSSVQASGSDRPCPSRRTPPLWRIIVLENE